MTNGHCLDKIRDTGGLTSWSLILYKNAESKKKSVLSQP